MVADPPILVSLGSPSSMESHTCSEHGVQEKDPATSNVLGKLVVEQLGHSRLLITLDQNLADTDRTAAISQSLLHSLSSAHDRHSADFALEHETMVRMADRSRDGVLDSW